MTGKARQEREAGSRRLERLGRKNWLAREGWKG
jgi:hypothetical protein